MPVLAIGLAQAGSRCRGTEAVALTALAIVSALFTIAFEIAWLRFHKNIPVMDTFGGLLAPVDGPPSGLVVLGAGCIVAAISWPRNPVERRQAASRA